MELKGNSKVLELVPYYSIFGYKGKKYTPTSLNFNEPLFCVEVTKMANKWEIVNGNSIRIPIEKLETINNLILLNYKVRY